MPREALIVGLGLIGGSAGIALRRRGWRIRYLDPHVELRDALSAGAADERSESLDGNDLVLFATPVDIALTFLPQLDPGRAVTSACSVMRPLTDASSAVVAGHPLAGSEARGLAAADGSLFEGARWFLSRSDEAVEQLVRDCGANAEVVDPVEHDAGVALASHLPQLLSTALASLIAEHPEALRYAGGGLRTFLRLAGSDATVWRATLEANRENLLADSDAVARIARAMLEGDPTATFEKAQDLFRRL